MCTDLDMRASVPDNVSVFTIANCETHTLTAAMSTYWPANTRTNTN